MKNSFFEKCHLSTFATTCLVKLIGKNKLVSVRIYDEQKKEESENAHRIKYRANCE